MTQRAIRCWQPPYRSVNARVQALRFRTNQE